MSGIMMAAAAAQRKITPPPTPRADKDLLFNRTPNNTELKFKTVRAA
jgi:hypothetical protein